METELESGLLLRGYIDRLDVAPDGQLRVVDYKTGAAPRQVAEARALFQMKFYALALLHLRGVVPTQLRLLYLADAESLTYQPDEAELRRFERTLDAIWQAILRAGRDGDFRPSPEPDVRVVQPPALCPAWDGTPPEYPGWPQPTAARPSTGRADRRRPSASHDRTGTIAVPRRAEPYYLPLEGSDGARFHATSSTTGPWFADAQHVGPPSALLVRALERATPAPAASWPGSPWRCSGRCRPARCRCRAQVERPGRAVELLAAEMAAGGRAVLRARAWRLAVGDTAAVAVGAAEPCRRRSRRGCATGAGRRAGCPASSTRSGVAVAARAGSAEPGPGTVGRGSGCRWCAARSRARCSGSPWSPTRPTARPPRWTCATGCSSTPS